MGCTHSLQKQEKDGNARKINENGFKNLFYATTEFDLSESENEDEILSVQPKHRPEQPDLPKRVVEMSNGLTIKEKDAPTTRHTLLDNRLDQTCV